MGFYTPFKQPVPESFGQWIGAPGSLTAHLQASCKELSVNVLYQGSKKPWAEEAQILSLRVNQSVLVREVILICDQHPMVLARTVVSFEALKHVWKPVAELGNQPLGYMLFSNAHIKRSPLCKFYLPSGSVKNRWVHRVWKHATGLHWKGRHVWGRQSCFILHGWPMLVEEYFEPSIVNLSLIK